MDETRTIPLVAPDCIIADVVDEKGVIVGNLRYTAVRAQAVSVPGGLVVTIDVGEIGAIFGKKRR